ncbi:MAG: hypothetical protein DCF15_19285 [Phormidesmis priestleyi]|uniref:Uncharacterized protein n=1 Tax=Phormidesmis priestleyi TaxID=268141 RepID=A0A2W4WQJ6_9CYAN|nr:MAG: hypothetical protein DCF15_19285 [Phormidesmis priestleyi]
MIYINEEKGTRPLGKTMPSTHKSPRRRLRLVDIAIGVANAAVLGLSVAFSNGAFSSTPALPPKEIATNSLFETLSSPKFEAFQREYVQQQTARNLAEAEGLKAEAEGLKLQAAADAGKTKEAAEQAAADIRLEASYDGVEQRYHRPEGFEITLNYPTTVEKEQTEFGYTATARPTTDQGTVRVYVNLATVNEGFVPAGGSIGTVGTYPVGEGVKTF